jgi:hypothetical protein
LLLPSPSILLLYKYSINQGPGFHPDICTWIDHEEVKMVLKVESTHKGHIATKPEGRTVEKKLQEIKHTKEGIDRKEKQRENKKDYVGQESRP